MKSFEKEKNSHEPFTGFRSTFHRFIPIGRYKFHINLDNESFKIYKDAIVQCIDSLDSLGVLAEFKYFNYTAETINNYYSYSDSFKLLNLVAALRQKDVTKAEQICETLLGGPGVKNEAQVYIGYVKRNEECGNELMRYENSVQTDMDSHLRFVGQAQFTLYFSDDVDVKKLEKFCLDLNQYLQKMEAKPGKMADSDLYLTPYLSLRQRSFDNSTQYIAAVHEDKNLLEKNIKILKEQAANSVIYKTLKDTFQAKPSTMMLFKPPSNTKPDLSEKCEEPIMCCRML